MKKSLVSITSDIKRLAATINILGWKRSIRPPFYSRDEADIFLELQSILDTNAHTDSASLRNCEIYFRTPATVLAQYRAAKGHLSLVPNLAGSRGLDFACWCGFMTWMMIRLGAGEVWGSDVIASHIDAAQEWSSRERITGLNFRCNAPDEVPYEDYFFDWVVTSGLYSNLNPSMTPSVFAGLHRVLKPGGLLLFNDGGNILHPPTAERVLACYREMEIGAGTEDDPQGCFYRNRLALITESAPDLEDAQQRLLARETCYLWRPEIEAAIAEFRSSGKTPERRYLAGIDQPPPVAPSNGNAAARANDPHRIRAELEDVGFSVYFTAYCGTQPLSCEEAARHFSSSPGLFLVGQKSE